MPETFSTAITRSDGTGSSWRPRLRNAERAGERTHAAHRSDRFFQSPFAHVGVCFPLMGWRLFRRFQPIGLPSFALE